MISVRCRLSIFSSVRTISDIERDNIDRAREHNVAATTLYREAELVAHVKEHVDVPPNVTMHYHTRRGDPAKQILRL